MDEMRGPKDWSPYEICNAETAENIAALSYHIGFSENHMKAYEAAKSAMGGFTGFYMLGAEMGLALTDYSKLRAIRWGGNAEYPDTMMALAEAILKFMIKNRRTPETPDERKKLIESSISWNRQLP